MATAPEEPAKTRHKTSVGEVLSAIGASKGSAPSQTVSDNSSMRAAAVTALDLWLNAKEALDLQLEALRQAMNGSGDRRLQRIADLGLNGLSKNFQVGLRVALKNLESADGEALAQARAKTLNIVTAYQKLLAENQAVRLCDSNPLRVKVTIKQTLGTALTEVERLVLSAAP